MRMIDRPMEIDILAGERRATPSLYARVMTAVNKLVRTWQNRSALNRLSELSDSQLLDIGLRRSDVREVTSTFFAEAGLHLTLAARERARRHLRTGRMD